MLRDLQGRPKGVPTIYTGIDVNSFEEILILLGDSVKELSYKSYGEPDHCGRDSMGIGRERKLSVEEELLLTLCKLWHGFPESDQSARFSVSQTTVF